jgi:tRNA pseudouridine synthase 9
LECKPLTGRTHQIRVHLKHLGYPIANDPLYCCDKVWTKDTAIEDVIENAKNVLFPDEDDTPNKSSVNHKDRPLDDDADCLDCKYPKPDPVPEQMFIYLHAFKYQGDGWEYETKKPFWAHDEYDGDKVVEDVFWKNGGVW